jgi:hypothetical protein
MGSGPGAGVYGVSDLLKVILVYTRMSSRATPVQCGEGLFDVKEAKVNCSPLRCGSFSEAVVQTSNV